MAFEVDATRKAIYRLISLNGGGFSSPEAGAIRRALDLILEALEDHESRIDTLEP